jgi:acyl-CoA synthetase (NDP forming)
MTTIKEIILAALGDGRQVLLEHELLDAMDALGLPVPSHCYVESRKLDRLTTGALGPLAGRRAVLKVVSDKILHKSDVGGVVFLEEATPEAVQSAARAMIDGLPPGLRRSVRGILVEEALPCEPGLGRELLVGMRLSREFGTIYTLGFGGTYVEAIATATLPDQSTILFKPGLTSDEHLARKLDQALFFRWASGQIRGVDGISPPDLLHAQLMGWVEAMEQIRQAVEAEGACLEELELNPLVWHPERRAWMPVDAMARLGAALEPRPSFPVASLRRALHPEQVAIIGASARGINVGRIILRSMLDGGCPLDRVCVVREDAAAIDGAAGVSSLEALPAPVDLLVVAVAADSVPQVVERALASGMVTGAVLLIPGGMGETTGGRAIEQQVVETVVRHAAARPADRPVIIGNNSLGLVSRPLRFDSLFIPREKLPRVENGLRNVALISQSGAFMITAMTKLDFLGPDYQISLGNQIDARISDFVAALADEPQLATYALYIEGLKPGDGERLANLVSALVARGRDVVVYKAGRSPLGRSAARGHTASVAGDHRVFTDMLHDAGALVAESFTLFLDLVRLSGNLNRRGFSGRRIGLMSNAGYEAVGLADNHRGPDHVLEPATFSQKTVERITAALAKARIDQLVTVTNPLDITPMANDAVHEACMRAILDDPGVDAAIFGNVPLTAMVNSLPRGVSERDVFDAPEGYANRTIALFLQTRKPFVVVIDAGRLYDPLADYLQWAGVPTFRSADRAIRLFGRYLNSRRTALERR